MATVTKKVRSDDLVRVKPITAKLAGIPDPTGVFEDKSNRGWNNIHFGRMLAPFLDLAEYDADPDK